MPLLTRFRRRRAAPPAPAAPLPARPAPGVPPPDRSALLRELEVAVPAPERLVRWEDAAGSQRRVSA